MNLCFSFTERPYRLEAVHLLHIFQNSKGKTDASTQDCNWQLPAVLYNPPPTHYLQVFFVVVIHNSQEERHEDVSVDNDKGNEEQGIP